MTTTIGSLDLNAFSDLYSDSTQYFWFEGNASASYGAGVHVTLVPDTLFINNPTGQNILMNTDGISIRNGLLPMMTLDNDSLDFNIVDTTAGTYTTTATFTSTGAQIGQSNDAHLSMTNGSLSVLTDKQVEAFSVETSSIEKVVSRYMFNSISDPYIPPNSTVTSVAIGDFMTTVPNGTEFTQTIAVRRVGGGLIRTNTFDFVFTKGVAKTGTTTMLFVVENATSMDDTESLTITVSYDGSDKITLTAPNFYRPTPLPQNSYYNGIQMYAVIIPVYSYTSDVQINGEVTTSGNFYFGTIEEYANMGRRFAATSNTGIAHGTTEEYSATILNSDSYVATQNDVIYLYIESSVPSLCTSVEFGALGPKDLPPWTRRPIANYNTATPYYKGDVIGLYYDGTDWQEFCHYDDKIGSLIIELIILDWYDDVIV